MAISKCISLSVENKIEKEYSDYNFHINETGYHGTSEFPVAIYLDDVTNEYVNWHWHEEFEIGFVEVGSVVVRCGNRTYHLECGDIFFINSNVLHSMHKHETSDQAAFKSVAFDSSIISENINSIFYTKYLSPILANSNFKEYMIYKDSSYYQGMIEILSNVWNLVYSESVDYEIKVRNELSTLFCTLNRLQETIKETYSYKKTNYLSEKRVQHLLNYIHAHYQDKITIEELAKNAAISKTEVLRCFKAVIGQSPVHYLNGYRLQRAAYFLVNTEKNIQEIAADCGFDDNSYFSKLFKKKYHMSPYQYRLYK